MKNSIGIIGMGWVGSSVAISILHRGICRELLLNDAREGIAEGEAMDLNHGTSFFPTADIRAVDVEEMLECRAIVVTAGRGGSGDESRLELLKDNIHIAREISGKLTGYKGILIVVSNPVDVLTYFYQKYTGIPASRVIGTGTLLDTARLREAIANRLHIEPKTIHAQVVGEHGDSELVLWSRASIGGLALRNWKEWKRSFEKDIEDEVRSAAYEIIRRKGATNHAIGLVTAELLKWILGGERRVVTLSSVLSGEYGLSGLAISLPVIITEKGLDRVLDMELNEEEWLRLKKSAEVIKEAIRSDS
jgi:L-lactate dehydrogenase